MIPIRVIGFKATARDERGEYDCSFMVMHPANENIHPMEVDKVCQEAITSCIRMHPNANVTAKVEKVIMMRQG